MTTSKNILDFLKAAGFETLVTTDGCAAIEGGAHECSIVLEAVLEVLADEDCGDEASDLETVTNEVKALLEGPFMKDGLVIFPRCYPNV
jgi:hypothetical protein